MLEVPFGFPCLERAQVNTTARLRQRSWAHPPADPLTHSRSAASRYVWGSCIALWSLVILFVLIRAGVIRCCRRYAHKSVHLAAR
jgi:hypothetical protein